MSSVPVTLHPPYPPDTAILPQLLGECTAGITAVPGPDADATVMNPAAYLWPFSCFWVWRIHARIHVWWAADASVGIKDALSPREEAAGSESQHICDGCFLPVQFCISLSIVFLFVSLTPRPANFLFHVCPSSPLCSSLLIFSHHFPPISGFSFACCTRHPYQSDPPVFIHSFLPSISTISPSYCHTEGR